MKFQSNGPSSITNSRLGCIKFLLKQQNVIQSNGRSLDIGYYRGLQKQIKFSVEIVAKICCAFNFGHFAIGIDC